MASENDTIADIVAEMRIFKCRNLETGELELCNAIANYFADRLEAARKRELLSKNAEYDNSGSVVVGGGKQNNAATMREALNRIVDIAYADEPKKNRGAQLALIATIAVDALNATPETEGGREDADARQD